MKKSLVTALLLQLLGTAAMAANDADAIEHLLESVGSSECTFIRNGKEYSSVDAENHLRMKYRRGKKWASDADAFIERLASKSSFSGKPYRIRCGANPAQLASEWLTARLVGFRNENGAR